MEHVASLQTTRKRFQLSASPRVMPIKMVIFAIFNAASAEAIAAPFGVECPTEIAQHAVQLPDTPGGWTPFVASPIYLHSAGMAGASPEKLVALVGHSKGRPGKSAEWSTTYTLEGPYPDGKWMECGYGEFNQIILSKRLKDDTQECTVTYRKGEKAGQNHLKIVCR